MHGVLTLAGEGTRMLPWSRGLRKEFLPLVDSSASGGLVLKPVAHFALESLIQAGADRITLVVARRDEQIARSYFSIDEAFLDRHAAHPERLAETAAFYRALEKVRIDLVLQPEPKGFGDAVLRARPRVGLHPFLVHAADAVLMERPRGRTLREMGRLRDREALDAVLLVRRVPDPGRYGVVEGQITGRFGIFRRMNVTGMEEKPSKPNSPWAATAVYAFSPRIFTMLRAEARASRAPELELTAGIVRLLRAGGRVAAL
ncbi:MAG: nucleotidyltransferase family protein, partial [Thermoplasmata archaeon]|nr:nucleotidyltransferase family protein [Thermoplasmata archaeon]